MRLQYYLSKGENMLKSEFLKQFNICNKYLKSIILTSKNETEINVAKNQLFVLECISYGLVANPDLFKYLMNPRLAKLNPLENLDFISKDIINDDNQCLAVKKIVSTRDLLAIQGPPGTGKTTVIVEAIQQLNKKNQNAKILLTSATHVAVDNVMERLVGSNLKLLRIKSKGQENQYIKDISIDNFLEKATAINPIINDYLEIFKTKYLSESFYYHDVIGVTINALKGCNLNPDNYFDYAIIDEVCKITLPELLFVAKYAKKLILIGDPKQLPPSYSDYYPIDEYSKEEYDYINLNPYVNKIFQHINPETKLFLKRQYRMVQEIGNYISDAFYNDPIDKLENGRKDSNPYGLNFINYDAQLCVVPKNDVKLQNHMELDIIKELLNTKLKDTAKEDVAIISPYKDQVRLLRKELEDYVIDTVDSFQGQAAKIVIFSCVRNSGAPTSFFKKENRLNVAISRSKNQVWVIGSKNYASKVEHLKLFINYSKQEKGLTSKTYVHQYKNGHINFKY